MEWSRHHGERSLVASWPQFGVPCGLFLSNLAVLAFSSWSGDQFAIWGWRIPFAISIVLVGVGLWIRLGILETPVFRQLVENQKIERAPLMEVIKKQPKEIILSALLRMAEQAPFYIFTAFIFAYAVGTLKMSRDLILRLIHHHPAVGTHLRPYRTQKHVPDRGRIHWFVRVPVFRNGRYGHSIRGVHRDRAFAHSARRPIRPPGGAHRGGIYASFALQRLFARLSARLRHRRRTGTADRYGIVRALSLGLRDLGVHPLLAPS
jgi:hypothetical protein